MSLAARSATASASASSGLTGTGRGPAVPVLGCVVECDDLGVRAEPAARRIQGGKVFGEHAPGCGQRPQVGDDQVHAGADRPPGRRRLAAAGLGGSGGGHQDPPDVVWPLEPCAEEMPEPPENPELDDEPELAEDPELAETREEPDERCCRTTTAPVPDVVPLAVLACDEPGRT